ALFSLVGFIMLWVCILLVGLDDKKHVEDGMIRVGQSAIDMEGKNYQAVMEQLDSAGFTNISTVDLNDAGWFSNKEDTIESVAIGGDVSFASSEYYDPETKIVITYH
nr:hypothetical protein [Lachnospiraceae bacterium]